MTNRRRFTFWFTVLAALMAAILLLDGSPQPELVLQDGKGATLAVLALRDRTFDHVYTHSVHKTPVVERFRIVDSGGVPAMHLFELRYQSQGVGMPAGAEGGYRLEKGTFVLSMDRTFHRLPCMISPVSGHGLVIEGRFVPFLAYKPSGFPIVLTVRMTRHIRLRR